ncbi:hypothetical protein [Lactiplantibacillus plantarum]|uniref:hypothetical protein n=1 Tax=Lactiplantibacillus plantarum TaxID=1590 RepID=UPI000EB6F605|nr:hypothetical protein [Lactiplantibacillus plantarum]AYC72500.1 hypothetical protein D5289_10960 [Lactiplantibacillus plantarum]
MMELKRSKPYPAKSIKETVHTLSRLSALYGQGKISDDVALENLKMNRRTSTYSYAKASAFQYGLISPVDKRHFKVTDYGESFFSGASTNYSELLKKPEVYTEIFKRFPKYDWQSDDELILIMSNYGIIASKIKNALKVLYKNIADADIQISTTSEKKLPSVSEKGRDLSLMQTDIGNQKKMKIAIDAGDITLTVPRSISSDDSKMISGMIDLFLQRIQEK